MKLTSLVPHKTWVCPENLGFIKRFSAYIWPLHSLTSIHLEKSENRSHFSCIFYPYNRLAISFHFCINCSWIRSTIFPLFFSWLAIVKIGGKRLFSFPSSFRLSLSYLSWNIFSFVVTWVRTQDESNAAHEWIGKVYIHVCTQDSCGHRNIC